MLILAQMGGEVCQGFPPWPKGRPAHEPTEHEAGATWPPARQPAQLGPDEPGQRGARDQRRQRQTRGGGNQESARPGLPVAPMAPLRLIVKVLLVEGVVFE
jgi:hypothetical protein